jgi:Leucine-rich repeat (LRR) protein
MFLDFFLQTLVINTNDESYLEISFTRVLQWIKPRAESVLNLTFEEYCVPEDEVREPEAMKPSTIAAEEESFRYILKAVAPTLHSLKINSCDAGLGFPLRWNILKDFTAASKSLTRLELLFIDDGNLTSAHVEDIKVFKNLVHLKLRWMPIWEYTYLDRTVMEASHETLRSQMSLLPINLFDLKHLETLHLDSEWLHGPFSFPRELERLKNLSELGLTNQNLSNVAFLPETLTKLTLSGSNDGPSIVENSLGDYLISNSRNLVELDLSHCNLRKFDLGYDESDDEDYGHSILGSIQKLNLSSNSLLGPLPQISLIDNMLSLKHLNLSSCGLSVLPDSAISCLNHMETLDLSSNNLVDLPPFEWHNNMKHMVLHDNKFPTIPESLKKLRNLVTVDLGMCPYLEIPKSISEWLVALKHLVRFEASKVKGSDRSARFQVASLKWLEEAEKELEIVGRPGILNYKARIPLPLK